MIFYTVTIFMFQNTCTAKSITDEATKLSGTCTSTINELVVACLLAVVGISDVVIGYWLMNRESDEAKEGDNAFIISRKPLEFIL
jgi:hypothetical protein